ncbi:molecular chaperone TorD family protein [bacterium]|nr:molecular chaperone TorD family protein [bacterium]
MRKSRAWGNCWRGRGSPFPPDSGAARAWRAPTNPPSRGAFRRPLLLPTASDYLCKRDDSQSICRTLEMFYRAFGFNYVPHVRPDHLAVQWSFARFLLQSEETAEASGPRDKLRMLAAARLEFARAHLLVAVQSVYQPLQRRCRHPFYRGVGSLAEEVVNWLLERPIREAGDSRVVDEKLLDEFDPSRVGYSRPS